MHCHSRKTGRARLGLAVFLLAGLAAAQPPSRAIVAPRPPMGWNSFDAYDGRIDEGQFRRTVDYMAANLKEFGWEYAVIDYIWFNPAPGRWNNPERRHGHPDLRLDENGRPLDRLAMDRYGRLLPAVERFPSAAGAKGFKPLADYVHAKGLKFGIHIMRGIPRQAYFEDTPVLGTSHTAREIAAPWDVCPWNNNMFGVDPARPGAQAYYDSLFQLYAEWGVDFVKADDMLHPVYHRGEIEMIRKALERCGRPMALSLSPGKAPFGMAWHLRANAEMWRISNDFWDDWDKLARMFELLDSWSPFIGAGHWPDADMLPIGHLSLDDRPHGPDRLSKFTWEEHQTLMTLWSIARSPLMMGGDLLSSPEKSLAFLKNREVLAVNQDSADNRQVYRNDTSACWIATEPRTGDRYVALFNLKDAIAPVTFDLRAEMLRGTYRVRDLWKQQHLEPVEGKLTVKLGPHGAGLYRLSR